MIRFALPLLALFSASVAAAQASPGQNCNPSGKPPMWLLEDADSRIHLFGTVASLPEGVEWFGPEVDSALAESDELVTEIAEADLELDPAAMAAVTLLPSRQKLPDLLDPEQAERLHKAVRSLGHPGAMLDRLRPWTVAYMLSSLASADMGIDPKLGGEQRFYREARQRGLKATGLETTKGQLEALAAVPEPVQISYLMQVVDDLPGITSRLQRMIQAWANGDLCDLEAALADERLPPEMHEAILAARNRTWASQIEARLAGNDTLFVAVTAGHFVGPGNLMDQLQARGLIVRRVQ